MGGAAGPGPAVATPGSVFTVVVEEHSRRIAFRNLPLILDFPLRFCVLILMDTSGQCWLGA